MFFPIKSIEEPLYRERPKGWNTKVLLGFECCVSFDDLGNAF